LFFISPSKSNLRFISVEINPSLVMLSKTKSCGEPSTALVNEIKSLILISFVEILNHQ